MAGKAGLREEGVGDDVGGDVGAEQEGVEGDEEQVDEEGHVVGHQAPGEEEELLPHH